MCGVINRLYPRASWAIGKAIEYFPWGTRNILGNMIKRDECGGLGWLYISSTDYQTENPRHIHAYP